jgi:hypothetical protein
VSLFYRKTKLKIAIEMTCKLWTPNQRQDKKRKSEVSHSERSLGGKLFRTMQVVPTVAVSPTTSTTTTQQMADEDGSSLSLSHFFLTTSTSSPFFFLFWNYKEKEVDEQLDMTSYKPNRKIHFTPNEDHSLLRQYVALRVQDLSRSTIDWSKIGRVSSFLHPLSLFRNVQ